MPSQVRHFTRRALKALIFSVVIGAMTSVPGRESLVQAQGGPPAGLPPQASDRAEEQFEGELEVHYEDSVDGAKLVHGLRIGNQRLEMRFDDNTPPAFEHGTRVRVRGRRSDNTLSLKSGGDVQVLGLSTNGTFGEQHTLVVLVNFQDNTATPHSWATVHSTTFQTVSNFYRENSYDQTWLSGDVVGYYTLPMTSSVCDYNKIATLGEQAASAAGVNVSAYSRRVFVFPDLAACSWWGLGNVGGNPSRAWVSGSYTLFVAAHELGHNFGNHHSKSQPCSSTGCSTIEYGDSHDIMGNKAAVHTNAFQKERLGWLNYGGSPPIQTVSTSGAYTIDPMATLGVYPKALKILKSGTTAGSRTFYYVEVRTSTGFDAAAAPGVLIHTGSESAGNTSFQLDMAPTTTSFDALLDAGQIFTDSTIGLTIRTISAGAGGATVDVTVGAGSAPTCVTRAPTVSLSPSGTRTTDPGQNVTWDATIRNNDDPGCAGATFALASLVPSGWSGGFDRPSVSISPGTNGIAVLNITPSSTATGTSAYSANANRTGSTGPSGSITGSVSISTVPTSIDVTVSAVKSGNTIQMSGTVRAGGVPVPGVTVSFRLVDPKGSARTASATTSTTGVATASIKLRPKDPKGTYQVQATATLSGISDSALTTVVN
jgi:hypothetical protein